MLHAPLRSTAHKPGPELRDRRIFRSEPPSGAYIRARVRKHLSFAAVAAVNALLAMVATYALLRGYDVCFTSEANPATIVWSAHVAMFWRLGVGLYVGGFVAMVAAFAGQRDIVATVRVTAILVPAIGALIAIQGAFFP